MPVPVIRTFLQLYLMALESTAEKYKTYTDSFLSFRNLGRLTLHEPKLFYREWEITIVR